MRVVRRSQRNVIRRWLDAFRARARSAPAASEFGVIMRGFAAFQVLVAGSRLGLFNFLAVGSGRTVEEVRQHLAIPDHAVRALLLASTSLGLVRRSKRDGTYRNAAYVDQAMTGPAGRYRAAHLEAFNHLLYKPFYHLTEALQQGTNVGLQVYPGTGKTLYERLESDPDGKRIFYEWMTALTGSHKRVPDAIVEAFGEAHHVLDVGGGDAGNAIELVRRLPGLKVTIVDLPNVCKIAARDVAAAGFSGRVQTSVTEDFVEEALPGGADGILFAHIFNIYSDETNQALVEKSASALPRGGKLAVYNMVSEDDQSGSWHAGFMSLYFQVLATGSGLVYPRSRYEAWFAKAGFSQLVIDSAEWGDAVFVGTM